MASQNTLSVLIPAFNAEQWIYQCLRSVVENTMSPHEIIVVNDGSKDNTSHIVKKFGNAVKLIEQPNLGPCTARNRLLAEATGEFVQFIDADDIIHRQRFEIMMNLFALSGRIDVVSSGYLASEFVETDLNQAYNFWSDKVAIKDLLEIAYLPCAGIFRRDLLLRIGPWNESLRRWVDLEYQSRIAAKEASATYVDLPLYGYRQHSGPRISQDNKLFCNNDDAYNSTVLTHYNLSASNRNRVKVDRYVFPFYFHLARGYARQGNQAKFRETLVHAIIASHRCTFQLKALLIWTIDRFMGIKYASVIIERILSKSR